MRIIKSLEGSWKEARNIVQNYGGDMPNNHLTTLLRIGNRSNAIGWWVVCLIVKLKELAKALRMNISFTV